MFRLLVVCAALALTSGHGRLEDPASRSSMWRYGFKNPRNDNDAELFCGGITKLWQVNKGKCGICGDAWDLPEPRPNEDGGRYGNGIIVRTYKAGEEINVRVNLVANHRGYMEFKVCPLDGGVKADQDCLDKYPLQLADGSGTKFVVSVGGNQVFNLKMRLPAGLKCERCVFQWHYKAGNNWGICEDGSGRLGCGPQEYFRGCADVKIE